METNQLFESYLAQVLSGDRKIGFRILQRNCGLNCVQIVKLQGVLRVQISELFVSVCYGLLEYNTWMLPGVKCRANFSVNSSTLKKFGASDHNFIASQKYEGLRILEWFMICPELVWAYLGMIKCLRNGSYYKLLNLSNSFKTLQSIPVTNTKTTDACRTFD